MDYGSIEVDHLQYRSFQKRNHKFWLGIELVVSLRLDLLFVKKSHLDVQILEI